MAVDYTNRFRTPKEVNTAAPNPRNVPMTSFPGFCLPGRCYLENSWRRGRRRCGDGYRIDIAADITRDR
jgi:hypothetical protein